MKPESSIRKTIDFLMTQHFERWPGGCLDTDPSYLAYARSLIQLVTLGWVLDEDVPLPNPNKDR